MQKSPNQDSQRQNKCKSLSFHSVSIFLLHGIIVVTATLATAHILTLVSKSQKMLKSSASAETAVEPPNVQPTPENIKPIKSKDNHQVSKGEAIALPLKNPSETPTKQKHQQLKSKSVHDLSRTPTANTKKLITHSSPQRSNARPFLFTHKSQQDSQKPPSQVVFELTTPMQNQHRTTVKQDLIARLREAKRPKERSQSVSKESPVNFIQTTHTQAHQTPAAEVTSQNQQQLSPNRRSLALKLSDIVVLALANNRSIKNAYLERIAQRQDLAVAEDKFAPDFTPSLSMSLAQSGSDGTTTTTNEVGLGAKMRISTGGDLSVEWTGNSLKPKIEFNQPLLRGAGINLNRASIETARLNEKSNVLGLKSTLTNTITDAILAYRNLLRAQERLKIEQLSLKSAQEILEINQALIEAGRLAPVEIIQSQTAIANRQVSLVAAQNTLESTRLALLQILDIDQNLNLVASEVPKASPVTLNPNKLRQLALFNQPEYLQAQLNQDKAKLDLLEAKNDRRWDLGLKISYGGTGDMTAGLNMTRTFGDLTKNQRFQRSQISLQQAENNLKDQRESLEIQVTDRIRDVNLSFKQVQLAIQARESSERQLEIEREKQRLGRGSGVFEIVSLENSLVEARNAELNSTIEYLNALTNLDRTVGTTLDTWQVAIETNKK